MILTRNKITGEFSGSVTGCARWFGMQGWNWEHESSTSTGQDRGVFCSSKIGEKVKKKIGCKYRYQGIWKVGLI